MKKIHPSFVKAVPVHNLLFVLCVLFSFATKDLLASDVISPKLSCSAIQEDGRDSDIYSVQIGAVLSREGKEFATASEQIRVLRDIAKEYAPDPVVLETVDHLQRVRYSVHIGCSFNEEEALSVLYAFEEKASKIGWSDQPGGHRPYPVTTKSKPFFNARNEYMNHQISCSGGKVYLLDGRFPDDSENQQQTIFLKALTVRFKGERTKETALKRIQIINYFQDVMTELKNSSQESVLINQSNWSPVIFSYPGGDYLQVKEIYRIAGNMTRTLRCDLSSCSQAVVPYQEVYSDGAVEILVCLFDDAKQDCRCQPGVTQ